MDFFFKITLSSYYTLKTFGFPGLANISAMQNQQMALELRRRRENQLLRIENAFKRMDQGRYGICGKCRKPIDEARLEVFPDVVTCISCS